MHDSSRVLENKSQTGEAEVRAGIPYRDPVAAARNQERVQARLDGPARQALFHILQESPDPDSAIVMLARLLDAARRDTRNKLATDTNLLHYACLVFAHSAWLGETLIRDPDLLRRIGAGLDLGRCRASDEFRDEFARFHAHPVAKDLSESMARFRKREYVRILLRDVLGIAGIGEITEEISALADALLEEAVVAVNAQLIRRFGPPQWVDPEGRYRDSRFAIISLGKLGGNEVNYSSDLDLLFLYEGGTALPGAKASNREYFIALAQKTTELLSSRTKEGQVFRIDLRLRPQGHEGELAVALPRALQYYSEIAQDWELQAMIKARHSAGDRSLSREFIRAITPFVYRPNLNFAAIKTALQTRERIDRRGRNRFDGQAPGRAINVKLDRGGIRDIEFLVQCLQRVYGGEETWLRSQGTLFALQKLHDKEHLSGKDFHALSKAYEFLRDIEHHLQLRQGQQSHQLPDDAGELQVLARRVGRDETLATSEDEFVRQVSARMAAVADIYRRTIYREQSGDSNDSDNEPQHHLEGPETPASGYGSLRRRLEMDAPELLAKLNAADISSRGRRTLDRFFNSAASNSDRYQAVLRAVDALVIALQVFECSDYLSEILIRHPEDVELLTDALEPPSLAAKSAAHTTAREFRSATDPEQAQAFLRQHFRRDILVANARDLFCQREIWEVLAANSRIADQAITSALALAGAPSGFAILALGRLGTREFDVLSDADMLFVTNESSDLDECRRAAERSMESLSAYTREGMVFPVDPRLRPHGGEGGLVTTPSRLAAYFSNEAKPWEAISYLRLRFVAGDCEVAERAVRAVQDGTVQSAQRSGFADELRDMRQRLELIDAAPNLKTGAGGSYDLDFLSGRLQVERGLWSNGNLAERLGSLQQLGLLEPNDARELAANAGFLRSLEHFVRLVTGRPDKWLPRGEHARAVIAKLMRTSTSADSDLAATLAVVLRRNREICLNYPF